MRNKKMVEKKHMSKIIVRILDIKDSRKQLNGHMGLRRVLVICLSV